MKASKEDFLKRLVYLDKVIYSSQSKVLQKALKKLKKEIALITPKGKTVRGQLRSYTLQSKKVIKRIFNDKMRNELYKEMGAFASKDVEAYERALVAYFGMPKKKAIKPDLNKYIGMKRLQFEDTSINTMFKGLYIGVTKQVLNQVREQYLLKGAFKGVSTKLAKRRAKTFYNTTVSIIKEDYRSEVEKKYSENIAGIVFDAFMDNRTTPFCAAHDNIVYKSRAEAAGKGVFVPAHYNCRSVMYPIPKQHFNI